MAILIFVLSLILLIAGGASGYESIDPFADQHRRFICASGSDRRLRGGGGVCHRGHDPSDRRAGEAHAAIRSAGSLRDGVPDRDSAVEEVFAAPSGIEAAAPESVDEASGAEDESPININRTGHLPSLDTIETVLKTPEEPPSPPSLIGSYSSAGANYKIFADGSIGAENERGNVQVRLHERLQASSGRKSRPSRRRRNERCRHSLGTPSGSRPQGTGLDPVDHEDQETRILGEQRHLALSFAPIDAISEGVR